MKYFPFTRSSNFSKNGKPSELSLPENDDLTLKEKELSIKEKELDLKEAEVKAKIKADSRNLWISSPLILAIFGVFSGGVATIFQGNSTLQLERQKFEVNTQLERQKFEFSLIQKSLETKDKKEAVKNLLFLVNSGIIQSLDAEKIRKLAENPEKLPTISISKKYGTVIGTSPQNKNLLYLRSGAGNDYGVVGTVQIGDRVQILSSSFDKEGRQWYRVDLKFGTTGWIAAQLIDTD